MKEVCNGVKDLEYEEFTEDDDIVSPDKAKTNSIIVFDDIACSPQSIIRDYFARGRHNLIDCFYICQTYSKIPKQLVRDNANFIIVFPVDELNLSHIYRDHANMDMAFGKFKDLCSLCWKNKYGFLVIDKDRDVKDGRYRVGFDTFVKL